MDMAATLPHRSYPVLLKTLALQAGYRYVNLTDFILALANS